MAAIRLENIVKRYDDGFTAVQPTSLQIEDGEFLVLVGPSGCGKSTTLRMIAGLEEVTAGKVLIGNVCVNDLEPGQRDIAMVFQNYALYPHMSVRENMAFGLRMRGKKREEIERRVHEAAEILSIESLLDRRPREMSGGQRQRVALGRAIVRNPAAFLFDEPLSNLDAKLRVQMRTELAQLHQRLGTTTVYVTHDQVEAMTLGERIVVMKEGVIQQVDTPLDLYHRPANRFVAGFIGSPAMNFVSGHLVAGCFQAEGVAFSLGQGGKNLQDGPVVLGFRPEALSMWTDGPKFLDASLRVVERMGDETVVYFEHTHAALVARIDGSASVNPGDRLPLSLNSGAWHLFGAEGEELCLAHGSQ